MTAGIPGFVFRLGVVLLLTSGLLMGGPLTAGVTAPAVPEIVGGAR